MGYMYIHQTYVYTPVLDEVQGCNVECVFDDGRTLLRRLPSVKFDGLKKHDRVMYTVSIIGYS